MLDGTINLSDLNDDPREETQDEFEKSMSRLYDRVCERAIKGMRGINPDRVNNDERGWSDYD